MTNWITNADLGQKGSTMQSKLRWLIGLAAMLALALTVSACGSGDDEESAGG